MVNVLGQQFKERLMLERVMCKDIAEYFGFLFQKVIRSYTIDAELGQSISNTLTNIRIIMQEMETTYHELLYKYSTYAYNQGLNHTEQLITQLTKTQHHTKNKPTITQQLLNTIQQQYNTPQLPSIKTKQTLQTQTTYNNKLPPRIQKQLKNYTYNKLPKTIQDQLKNYTYNTTLQTEQRINKNIENIIRTGVKQGHSIPQIQTQLQNKLTQLQGYETQRIVRTEVNTIQNNARYNRITTDPLIDYEQWISASDERVRTTHSTQNGLITRSGGTFPNGCKFPGDKDAHISEWINCRCTLIPYIPDYGMIPPPDKECWHEEEMIQTINPEDLQHAQPLPQTTQTILQGQRLSPREVNKLSFQELSDHYGLTYKKTTIDPRDGAKYHQFTEKLNDGHKFKIYFEQSAVRTYEEGGVATANEIIQEVARIPNKYKKETEAIWFKNTQKGCRFGDNGKFDIFGKDVFGYNRYYSPTFKGELYRGEIINGPKHEIIINPKLFKGGGKGKYAFLFDQEEGMIPDWVHTIHHEFQHSYDLSLRMWNKSNRAWEYRECRTEEYLQIHRSESRFTEYANSVIDESYAEHGGYVSAMLEHPELQEKKIRIQVGKFTKDINFEDYKRMYPKHYEYFKNLILEG